MGIQHVDSKRCNGCGHCVEICPQDVLRLNRTRKKAVIQYLRDCQSCFLCEMECPRQAIRVTPYREKRAVLAW